MDVFILYRLLTDCMSELKTLLTLTLFKYSHDNNPAETSPL